MMRFVVNLEVHGARRFVLMFFTPIRWSKIIELILKLEIRKRSLMVSLMALLQREFVGGAEGSSVSHRIFSLNEAISPQIGRAHV